MRRETFYSIFLISISLALFILIIGPKRSSISSLRYELHQKEMEFESFDKYFQEISVILEKIKGYQEEISRIEFALPDDPSFPLIFGFLQKSASQSGVLLEKLNLSGSSEEKGIKKWNINLSFKGNYSSLKSFLSVLEKSARLIKVERISFSAPQERELMLFDLTISVFSQ
jgi:Tfp pilus assembly protein PilO